MMSFPVEMFLHKLFQHSVKSNKYANTVNMRSGGLFAVKEKADLQTPYGVRGKIIVSMEQLLESYSEFSHITPNPYATFRYTNGYKEYVKGFEEHALMQINAFVVDIDTLDYSPQDILIACLDNSIGTPTLLLRSTRGYQLYFLLTSPMYMNKARVGLKVAKKIARSLKRSLQSVGADLFCNDFGFFRMPTRENTVWLDLEQTYSIESLIHFSERFEDEHKPELHVVQGKQCLTNQKWFKALLATQNVHGTKGTLGRNNMIFTLALCCYADKYSYGDAEQLLQRYNERLYEPLAKQEVTTIINSAYSGRYNGPERTYIQQLTEAYTNETATITYISWYKHKKERADRTRSHLTEWEQDIIQFIEQSDRQDGYVWLSQRTLCKQLGIPKSSLNKLIKQSHTIICKTFGKGRQAMTGFSTRQLVLKEMMTLLLHQKNNQHLFYTACIEELTYCEQNEATIQLQQLFEQQQPLYIPSVWNSS